MKPIKGLKILFVIRAPEHFPRYNSIIDVLCQRGHQVTALFDQSWASNSDIEKLNKFKDAFPSFQYQWLINRHDRWTGLIFFSRSLLTYRRFLLIKNQSSFFRERWHNYLPFWLRWPTNAPGIKKILTTKLAGRLLQALEQAAPADARITDQLKKYQPDVLIAPLGGIRVLSPTAEYIKAAVALGLPTASPTISWDSLTTKSLITVKPDIFLFWNEFHKKQAWNHHGIAPEHIRIIGSPVFDKWFVPRQPFKSRSDFFLDHGLNPNQPYVLYLGSAKGTAVDETWAVAELRKSMDNSGKAVLKNTQLVVRPHPANVKIYQKFSMPNVFVFPRKGALPDTQESFQLSYDTYFHAAAVTGIFTSAMMEAQIVNRPVIALVLEQYRETQEAAEHFRDFIQGGSLELAYSFDDFCHIGSLILKGLDSKQAARRSFVRNYVRPQGLTQSAGLLAAEEIEKLANRNFVKNRHE